MKLLYITLLLFICSTLMHAEQPPLSGTITDGSNPIPFATIQIKATNLGTASDKNGSFKLEELPDGKQTLVIKALGYKTKELSVTIDQNKPLNININLDDDVLGIDQVVVTADKAPKRRVDASMIVNAMTPKQLDQVQAVTLSDGLNFTSGVRMEDNCQNCGQSSVRMNGLDGSYSQVLINGRQIFSGLASVYGLEMIPSNMIQQIEIVKGGGSALYGSNAVAGTINLITKEPATNSFQAGVKDGLIGLGHSPKNDLNVNVNTSIVSDNKNSGLSLFANHRKRAGYDYNGDGFTEMAQLNNTTFGADFFYRMGYRNKLTLSYFNINENRRGGNLLDDPEHESDIAESIKHKINTAALDFTRFIGANNGKLSIYGSFQNINRRSYYSAKDYEDEKVLSDGTEIGIPDLTSYGLTTDFAYNYGIQLKNEIGKLSYIIGLEDVGDVLNDKELAYTDMSDTTYYDDTPVSDQLIDTYGLFAQVDYTLSKLTASVGVRVDNYNVDDRTETDEDNSGTVLSPRINLLYKPINNFQVRGSYSTGYRAPKVFDEDLHIEASGSRKVIHENAAGLKQETSHSYSLSGDYQGKIGSNSFEISLEGFYTNIQDPFTSEYEHDENSTTVTCIRENGDEAIVKGVSLECHYYFNAKTGFDLGFTTQKSQYNTAQAYYNVDDVDETTPYYYKDFMRTPNNYGYLTFNSEPIKNLKFSLNGTYTGSMLIEYYGYENKNGYEYVEGDYNTADPILNTDKNFFDLGGKLEYVVKQNKDFDIGISVGMKNIFNSFQSDFDSGRDRVPEYIYGPGTPRSIYFGIKIGNIL